MAAVAGGVAGLSAFEAHVINVTARIENALQVPTDPIDFGTVFPQEHLEKTLKLALSESFRLENRVDDVEYVIRQKPKCGITARDGEVLVGPTATGHVVVASSTGEAIIDCGPAPRQLEVGESWGMLPLLCPYLSKLEDTEDGQETDNDGSLSAFHKPWTISGPDVVWTEVKGRLAKSAPDYEDMWIIDLAVPCFGDHCAQDWEEFVHDHNPGAIASQYVLDEDDEHKIFGCDLWIEVEEVSEFEE